MEMNLRCSISIIQRIQHTLHYVKLLINKQGPVTTFIPFSSWRRIDACQNYVTESIFKFPAKYRRPIGRKHAAACARTWLYENPSTSGRYYQIFVILFSALFLPDSRIQKDRIERPLFHTRVGREQEVHRQILWRHFFHQRVFSGTMIFLFVTL